MTIYKHKYEQLTDKQKLRAMDMIVLAADFTEYTGGEEFALEHVLEALESVEALEEQN